MPDSTRKVAEVSVAISTLDRAADVRRCLEALACGAVLPAEVVVVDQSRDHRTECVAQECADRLPRLVYLRQDGCGLARAQNAAVAACRNAVIAVTDDDCIPDPAWIAVLDSCYRRFPHLAAVAGRVLPAPPVGDRVMAVSSRVSDRERIFAGRAAPWDVGSGNNFSVRKEWWDGLGGCDERLGPGSPGQGAVDMDLFHRLLGSRAAVRYEPAAVVLHQRQTAEQRRARRGPYGFGLGAACVYWLQAGDRYALRILASWFGMRLAIAARALKGRRPDLLREEQIVLWGTMRGIVHGLRHRREPRRA